jgi:hypothetical protein
MLVDVQGFMVDALAGLVGAGYAPVAPETVRAGGRKIEVVRMRAALLGRASTSLSQFPNCARQSSANH